MPHIFRSPFDLTIDEVSLAEPSWTESQNGLGFGLSHRVPFGRQFRWLLIEAGSFAAYHPAKDFHFITPTRWRAEWHHEPSPEQAPGYHRKGLRPDVSGQHSSPQQATGNSAVLIKIGLQSYALEFGDHGQKEKFGEALEQSFPVVDAPEAEKHWVNVMSVFQPNQAITPARPSFTVDRIRRIQDSELDTSRISEMALQFRRVIPEPQKQRTIFYGRER